jgi:hypothetical protein
MQPRNLLCLPAALVAFAALTACQVQPEPLPVTGLRTIDLRAALDDDDLSPVGG